MLSPKYKAVNSHASAPGSAGISNAQPKSTKADQSSGRNTNASRSQAAYPGRGECGGRVSLDLGRRLSSEHHRRHKSTVVGLVASKLFVAGTWETTERVEVEIIHRSHVPGIHQSSCAKVPTSMCSDAYYLVYWPGPREYSVRWTADHGWEAVEYQR